MGVLLTLQLCFPLMPSQEPISLREAREAEAAAIREARSVALREGVGEDLRVSKAEWDKLRAEEALKNSHDIGWAVAKMQRGSAVTRRGWNGKGMYLAIREPIPEDLGAMTQPYVFIKTVQGDLIPWLCSQADLLANDWEEVKGTGLPTTSTPEETTCRQQTATHHEP